MPRNHLKISPTNLPRSAVLCSKYLLSEGCALWARDAGGYARCTALYAGGREGGLYLLDVLEMVKVAEVMRCVVLCMLEMLEVMDWLVEVTKVGTAAAGR